MIDAIGVVSTCIFQRQYVGCQVCKTRLKAKCSRICSIEGREKQREKKERKKKKEKR